MAESGDFRGISGFIQFDPQEREAAGKPVRDISIRLSNTVDKKIRVTLWPDFKDVPIKKGDFVAVEGRYTEVTKDVEDGPVTYKNLSAQLLFHEGKTYKGSKPATTNDSSASADDEDEPF
jgi:hypothetical protein